MGRQGDWRVTVARVAVLAALAAAGSLVAFPGVARPPTTSPRPRLALLKRPRLVAVLLVSLLGEGGAFTVSTSLAPVLEQTPCPPPA